MFKKKKKKKSTGSSSSSSGVNVTTGINNTALLNKGMSTNLTFEFGEEGNQEEVFKVRKSKQSRRFAKLEKERLREERLENQNKHANMYSSENIEKLKIASTQQVPSNELGESNAPTSVTQRYLSSFITPTPTLTIQFAFSI